MNAIYKREVKSYFLSPVAYIFIGAFMLIAGIFFSLTNIIGLNANFSATLGSLTFVFMIIIPILTMRLFAMEKKEKTDQLLLTSSVSVQNIVLAKFLSAITVFAATLLLSLVFPFIISLFGTAVFGEILCSYFGFFLLGSVMTAIGMFISALTESQITAAIITAAVMLLLWIGDAAITLVSGSFWVGILSWISLFQRLEPFILGKLNLVNIIYYISFICFFVYASYISIEKRRWS